MSLGPGYTRHVANRERETAGQFKEDGEFNMVMSPWLILPGIKLSVTTDGGWSLPASQDLTKQIPLPKKFTLNPL